MYLQTSAVSYSKDRLSNSMHRSVTGAIAVDQSPDSSRHKLLLREACWYASSIDTGESEPIGGEVSPRMHFRKKGSSCISISHVINQLGSAK